MEEKRLFDILKGILTRVIPINKGGTGATTGKDALENLGIANHIIYDVVTVDNITINAGSYKEGTVSAAMSGYTVLGVIGWGISTASSGGQNAVYVFPYNLQRNSEGIFYGLKTTTTSQSAKVKLTLIVMYRRNY